jgi:hypothetical protein
MSEKVRPMSEAERKVAELLDQGKSYKSRGS